jgi:hypothetical protein
LCRTHSDDVALSVHQDRVCFHISAFDRKAFRRVNYCDLLKQISSDSKDTLRFSSHGMIDLHCCL